MRLIDADALREEHCKGCSNDIREGCKTDPVCASLLWVDDAPTVDAVEVVRCRECKYWKKDVPGCTDFVRRCELGGYMIGATGFCSYGERR
jgi:hypothetical protein